MGICCLFIAGHSSPEEEEEEPTNRRKRRKRKRGGSGARRKTVKLNDAQEEEAKEYLLECPGLYNKRDAMWAQPDKKDEAWKAGRPAGGGRQRRPHLVQNAAQGPGEASQEVSEVGAGGLELPQSAEVGPVGVPDAVCS